METITSRGGYERVARWHNFERTTSGVQFDAETDAGTPVEIILEFIMPDILRLRMSPAELQAEKPGTTRNYLLAQKEWDAISFLVSETPDRLELSTDVLRLDVTRDPWSIRLLDKTETERIVCREGSEYIPIDAMNLSEFPLTDLGFLRDPETGRVMMHETITLGHNEDLYGLGDQYAPINRVGQRFDLWATDARGTSQYQGYKNTPFLWSTQGYGLFVNTTFPVSFDLATVSLLAYGFTHEGPELDFFLICNARPSAILRRYWDLTGYAPVPPRWSFGLWMSRCGYQNRAEVEQVAQTLRTHDIPCDVIHLDPWWMGDIANWCSLQWDEDRFPDPAAMIEGLRQQGLRLCLWENPYVAGDAPIFEEAHQQGYFVQNEDGEPYMIDIWGENDPPTAVVDFTNPAAVAWWQSLHRPLLEQGVAVFKTDFGEAAPEDGVYYNGMSGWEVHNLYPLLYNRTVFEVTEEMREPGVVWSRSGWAGSQRYPTGWGAGSFTDFPYLVHQLRAALSLGLSGFPFHSHDIGGFFGRSDPELYVRWAQFGLFSSHSRCHGITPREPWEFGEEAETIFRRYAKLRYRLLPYIYSTAVQATRTGLPVVRALVLEYSQDPNVRHLDSEYLFGDNFLVAPVLERGARQRRVYLPAGEWVDYWSREIHEGPGWFNCPAPLTILPLFIRRGAIIPLGPEVDHTDQADGASVVFDLYPTDGGQFTLYEENSPPINIAYLVDDIALRLTITGVLSEPPTVILNHFPEAQRVTVDDHPHNDWRAEDGRVVIELAATNVTEITVWR